MHFVGVFLAPQHTQTVLHRRWRQCLCKTVCAVGGQETRKQSVLWEMWKWRISDDWETWERIRQLCTAYRRAGVPGIVSGFLLFWRQTCAILRQLSASDSFRFVLQVFLFYILFCYVFRSVCFGMSFLFCPQPLSPAKQRQRNVQKKCAARAKLVFFLIRPFDFFYCSRRRLALHDFIFLFE